MLPAEQFPLRRYKRAAKILNLLGCVVPREAYAQRAVYYIVFEAHCLQHMAPSAFFAGGASRRADAPGFKIVYQNLTPEARQRYA